ncbi:hypothetical protein NXZ74_23585, partial [Escherichia coli]|nr:hypothetical protein [Escherichia coli]
ALTFQNHTDCPLTDFGGKTSIFSHPVYLFLRKFSLQDSRGGSESGEQHVDIFINMFEDPIDDIISRNIEPKTFATLYKYIERIPFTPDVKKEFLSSIETINFS